VKQFDIRVGQVKTNNNSLQQLLSAILIQTKGKDADEVKQFDIRVGQVKTNNNSLQQLLSAILKLSQASSPFSWTGLAAFTMRQPAVCIFAKRSQILKIL